MQAAYDVGVLGAGPAGVAAAIRLRQLGCSVCLIDAEGERSIRKVGEALPGAAARLLRRLGISSLGQLLSEGEYAPCTANLAAWGSETWTAQSGLANPERGGWHLLRHKFDAALRRHAQASGVSLLRRHAEALHRPLGASDGYTIRLRKAAFGTSVEQIQARAIVDASGRAAWGLRQLGIRRLPGHPQLAAVAWLQRLPQDVDRATRIKAVSQGWWYTAPLPDGTRVVSFHGLSETVANYVRQPQSFVAAFAAAKLLEASFQPQELIEGPRARHADVARAEQVFGEGWLAVGDAALSFDPLSSQGIFFALYSGVRGAEALVAQDAGQERSALLGYAKQVGAIAQQNRQSRMLHYTAERRFVEAPYWSRFNQPRPLVPEGR